MTRTRPPARPTRRAGLALLLAFGLAPPARAEAEIRVTLATATPGGGFPAFGDAFVAALRAVDPALHVAARPSRGSVENLGLLRAGAVDLALVQGEYAYPALAGSDGLTVLAPMYPTPGLLVVPAAGPVRSFADLRGRPVAIGTHDSGLTAMGRTVLAAAGLDPGRDIRPILLDRAGDGPAMVLDGRADALWGGGLGWPGFVAAARAPGGARFLGAPPEAIARLVRPGSALRRLTVPAGSFAGQATPIETVGSWSLVLARPGLDPETAYRLVRALARARDAMAARHPQGAESDPRNLAGLVPAAWLNPGTARFLAQDGATPQ
ncbi:TAXI family TRAP transporter solute-binding subunit [Methylobacterium sp. NEAU 140]|uniref:TAXI family TRAP transporter solute-binding subunit n=1 Tax=Methylobacterium sp. NEAU 140 TaxID=3064945 RepID=UPI002735B7EF|nr:TAXI family TRAP transporter solute-binding subunit [Methylobacterium sp. NEAU 140]MDP4022660.1 TAXI family TRAP transporter solute-binding subunit [Methylobacterium sp. NEAU 140]